MNVLVATITIRKRKAGWNCWCGVSASLMLKVLMRFEGIEAFAVGGEASKVRLSL